MTPRRRRSPGLLAILVLVVAAGLVLISCGPDDTPSSNPAAPGLDRGAEIYASSCASCHGADMRGTDKGLSLLSILYEPNHHGDASFQSAIADGAPQHHGTFGDMPPVEGLSVDDVEAVIAYVRAEQERLGFEG